MAEKILSTLTKECEQVKKIPRRTAIRKKEIILVQVAQERNIKDVVVFDNM